MEAFKPDLNNRSLDFRKVASTSPAPPWFSPSAQNTTLPFADLEYLLALGKAGNDNFDLLGKAWVGDLMQLKHHIA
eukprot:9179152-Alexandrium_andersonii.AAC.1